MLVRLTTSWVACILTAVLFLVACYVSIWVVPKFEEIYRDLNILLPLTTDILIRFSHWHGWIILAMLGSLNIWLETKHSGKNWKLAVNGVGLFMGLALAMIIVIGIFAPLISIVEQLGNPNSA